MDTRLVCQDSAQPSAPSRCSTVFYYRLHAAHLSSRSTIVLRLEFGTSKGMSWRGSLLW